jgi:hypothetical protein
MLNWIFTNEKLVWKDMFWTRCNDHYQKLLMNDVCGADRWLSVGRLIDIILTFSKYLLDVYTCLYWFPNIIITYMLLKVFFDLYNFFFFFFRISQIIRLNGKISAIDDYIKLGYRLSLYSLTINYQTDAIIRVLWAVFIYWNAVYFHLIMEDSVVFSKADNSWL